MPFLIGQTQAAAEPKTAPGASKIWTPEALRGHYATLPDTRMSERLCKLVDLAMERKCFHVSGPTQSPIFGLSGKTGQKLVTIAPGSIYIWLEGGRAGLLKRLRPKARCSSARAGAPAFYPYLISLRMSLLCFTKDIALPRSFANACEAISSGEAHQYVFAPPRLVYARLSNPGQNAGFSLS